MLFSRGGPIFCMPACDGMCAITRPQWTPALSPNGEHLPHGMIFSCFMVSSMVGSAIAGRLLGSSKCATTNYNRSSSALTTNCISLTAHSPMHAWAAPHPTLCITQATPFATLVQVQAGEVHAGGLCGCGRVHLCAGAVPPRADGGDRQPEQGRPWCASADCNICIPAGYARATASQ